MIKVKIDWEVVLELRELLSKSDSRQMKGTMQKHRAGKEYVTGIFK